MYNLTISLYTKNLFLNKYMVTDKVAYIGTSNWSADYFVSTGGVGIALSTTVKNETNLHDQLESIFLRDWNSKYSTTVV